VTNPQTADAPLTRLDLAGQTWTLALGESTQDVPDALRDRLIDGLPATVPGCVHTDLLDAGLIDNPYRYNVEPTLLWIGRCDWRYTCRFSVDKAVTAHRHLDLCCDGLDTLATITLNGTEVASTANMHRRYRFDVNEAIQAGPNELVIDFAAPLPAADREERRYGALPHQGHGSNTLRPPHNMLRKMACNFGWDWGPVLTTSGVWRGIRLEAWGVARLGDVVPQVVAATPDRAVVAVSAHVLGGSDATVTYQLTDPAGQSVATVDQTSDEGVVTDKLVVDKPALWWPAGHGDQPLYTLTTTLTDTDDRVIDRVIDRVTQRVGMRIVELDTSPDDQPGDGSTVNGLPTGERMHLKVNGRAIFLKGANWIPDDCFPTRAHEPARLDDRIRQALDANMNALRIWGGGVYADPHFMARCDELGLLVWHDFMLACACYPEEQPYRDEVIAEARDNIARLAAHPSLAIWNGCNENIWGTFDWGDHWVAVREEGKRTWGLRYYLEDFPAAIDDLAPATPYWPASPYSGSMDRHPNANEFGNRHVWDVWHGDGQYRNYLGHFPRLSTEFGFHGPPHFSTLDAVVPDTPEQRRWDSPALEFHNRNGGKGNQSHTDRRIADDFDPPHDNLDDWLYLAQVMQARALDMGCSWFRALWPWCSGATYWQLNDCWPVSSWSAIDSAGKPKPLWFATRRFFAPRLITIKPTTPIPSGESIDHLAVYLHNDTNDAWRGKLALRRVDLAGQPLDEYALDIDAAPHTVQRLDLPDVLLDRPTDTALVAICDGDDAPAGWWWFEPDKLLHYPVTELADLVDAEVTNTTAGCTLTLTAKALVRDLCVFPDRLDPAATVSDNCLTLLPGQTIALDIATAEAFTAEQLTAQPVMQAANRFGKRG